MPSFLRRALAPEKLPWVFAAITALAAVIQCNPGWRGVLMYERAALESGEWWRIWTGHAVHFGWPHFLVDGGLFLLLGRAIENQQPAAARLAILLMPAGVTAGLYFCDPSLNRYAGLSGVNVGILVFLACRGWRKDWTDWFWPAVLALHVVELILERAQNGGTGGAMVPFDDPTVHVATSAHVAGAVTGVVLWVAVGRRKRGFCRCRRTPDLSADMLHRSQRGASPHSSA